MLPVLLHLPPLTVRSYDLLAGLALGLGFLHGRRLAGLRRLGLGPFLPFYAGLVAASWAGARLLFLLVSPRGPSWSALPERDGFVFYGGLLAGLAYVWLRGRLRGGPPFLSCSVLLPALALAHGTGRVGCFLAGCCHGRPFAGGPVLGLAAHPAQLYEALFLFVLAAAFHRLVAGGAPTAPLGLWYLSAYGAGRFVLESFRGDPVRGALHGLSTSQWISAALVLVCLAALAHLARCARQMGQGAKIP